jgi:hypothetical protein
VIYDVDYTALATDDSDLSDVVQALGAFTPIIVQGTFSLGSIINAVSITADTIEQVLTDAGVSIPFQSRFMVGPCPKDKVPQVFLVSMAVTGSATTSNPKKASARYEAQMVVGGRPSQPVSDVIDWRLLPATDRAVAPLSVALQTLHYGSAPFLIIPSLTIFVTAVDEIAVTNACAVNVSSISVSISTIPKESWGGLPNDFQSVLKLQGAKYDAPKKGGTNGKPGPGEGKGAKEGAPQGTKGTAPKGIKPGTGKGTK